MAVLGVFPILWLLGNYLHDGQALIGLSESLRGTEDGASGIGLIPAARLLAHKALFHLGRLAVLASVAGVGTSIFRMLGRRAGKEETLYVAIGVLFWASMLVFALFRGESLWDRYLSFGFVLLLPLAALPFKRLADARPWVALAVGLSLGASFATAPVLHHARNRWSPLAVTPVLPVHVERLGEWIRASPYRDVGVMATPMDWDSTYLPLYWPPIAPRYVIASM